MNKPRTWKAIPPDVSPLDARSVVEVIELEPVLDLLERLSDGLEVKLDPERVHSPTVTFKQLRHDVLAARDLLRDHGRLS